MASVTRNDPRDRRLAETFKQNYEIITQKEEILEESQSLDPTFNLQNIEIKQLNGDRFPGIPKMVELSQLWMSDHAYFWYFLQNQVNLVHLGIAVPI